MPSASRKQLTYETAEILGVYGQNGSGKTAIIDALCYLQRIMAGNTLEEEIADYIDANGNQAEIALAKLEAERGNPAYLPEECKGSDGIGKADIAVGLGKQVRQQYGSVNLAGIIGPAIAATAVSTGVAVVYCKVQPGHTVNLISVQYKLILQQISKLIWVY